MSWVNSKQFTISNRNGRHYVFRRNNAGDLEINIPQKIVTKTQARTWLKEHPNKVAAPNRVKPVAPVVKKNENYLVNIWRARGERRPWKMTCDVLKQTLKVRTVLGKGRQGIVYFASRYSNKRYPFAMKIVPRDLSAVKRGETQPAAIEYKIHSAAYEAAPDGVVDIHQLLSCKNFVSPSAINMANVQNERMFDKSEQSVILMEYCKGGSLASYMKSHALTDATFHLIISSILKTLAKIQKTYPYFRHNDLHLDNVFVNDRGFLIGDFGWARLEKDGTNPAVNSANGTKTASFWGVGPKTDPRYDHHLFLNEIRDWISRHGGAAKFPTTMHFLDVAVPVGYRGSSDTHVSEWRLKYGDECTDLPSLTRVIRSKYISGQKKITSPMLMAAKLRLRKTNPKRKVSPGGVTSYTNQQLINMSASNFLKLNKETKARAIALRKGKGKAVNKPMKVANLPKNGNKAKSEKRRPVPPAVLKNKKFDKLVEKMWKTGGSKANANFENAWANARRRAINLVRNRLARNVAPFTPSPPKAPKAKSPSPPKAPKAKVNINYKKSPSSGRFKIKAPSSGRYVYANGATIPMTYLKELATKFGINIKGVRSKANIASIIFSAK